MGEVRWRAWRAPDLTKGERNALPVQRRLRDVSETRAARLERVRRASNARSPAPTLREPTHVRASDLERCATGCIVAQPVSRLRGSSENVRDAPDSVRAVFLTCPWKIHVATASSRQG